LIKQYVAQIKNKMSYHRKWNASLRDMRLYKLARTYFIKGG